MPDIPDGWVQADSRAAAYADTDDDRVRGWRRENSEETVVRCPRRHDDGADLPEYGVYHFLRLSESGRGTNQQLLYRNESAEKADSRLQSWLADADQPDPDDRLGTALDPVTIRRHELSHVASLEDWAHLTGAEYYMSEKIGNKKRSSGTVAIFDGSHRYGEGAYVALASVNGPGGKRYASIGTEPNGYYSADQRLTVKRDAMEITNPTVTFDGDTLTVSDANGHVITITAQTDNPTHCVYDL